MHSCQFLTFLSAVNTMPVTSCPSPFRRWPLLKRGIGNDRNPKVVAHHNAHVVVRCHSSHRSPPPVAGSDPHDRRQRVDDRVPVDLGSAHGGRALRARLEEAAEDLVQGRQRCRAHHGGRGGHRGRRSLGRRHRWKGQRDSRGGPRARTRARSHARSRAKSRAHYTFLAHVRKTQLNRLTRAGHNNTKHTDWRAAVATRASRVNTTTGFPRSRTPPTRPPTQLFCSHKANISTAIH